MTMTSPARRHQARIRAAQAAASVAPGESLAGASQYELMLAKLETDKRRLKAIQSVARKVEVKREVLPEYDAYVSGALAGGRGGQDDVLMTIMIWRVDAGDYAGALDIARYALRYGLTLPDQYERSTAAALAEEFATAALAAAKNGESFDPEQLVEVAELTADADMHDQIRAKLHKAIGVAAMNCIRDERLDGPTDWARASQAVQNFKTALSLDDRAGVKQNIARLQALLSDAEGRRAARRK
ncbi:phage terminase small subunit [Burkholderia multivorans]|uniref:phage terminase small subunit n=1 Tax=Burkholderia multivorans TaxID=87883 RepID=UPI0015E283F7|nr:phage terminase small subunit [Burkholderia multivorans]MBR7895704.1 terminase [Burkholderia multivorans]MBU9511766.1 terminase [Burkholderia multivorans]MBU9539333.1 terminase [Burkholderia multivorans]MBU9553390.1 terminase [Burkholderia multivorans]MBU9634907.1 terminase [Burkholderia multivorans]